MSLTSEIRPKTGSLPILKSFVTVINLSLQACYWAVLLLNLYDFNPLIYMKSSVFCASLRISKICTRLLKQKIKDFNVEFNLQSFFLLVCISFINDGQFFKYFFSLWRGKIKCRPKRANISPPPPPNKNLFNPSKESLINLNFFTSIVYQIHN